MEQHKIYGITGFPLGHSRSPALHNWAFETLQHKGHFFSWQVPPDALGDFVRSVRLLHIHGVCVTIPHKEAIIPFLDEVSPRALHIGAVNTLYWHDEKLCGENTDIDGFLLPLRAQPVASSALILGAGGAARAVVAGLQELGIEHIFITNRDAARATTLAKACSAHTAVQTLDWHMRTDIHADWVINTTPLGMDGTHKDKSPYTEDAFSKSKGLAYDLVYNPLHTRFLQQARAAGWHTQDGLDMFVGQALRQMELWTHTSTNFAATRAQVEQTLA